jgi:hypothetical protein
MFKSRIFPPTPAHVEVKMRYRDHKLAYNLISECEALIAHTQYSYIV